MASRAFYRKYFSQFPGMFQTGDSARKDEDDFMDNGKNRRCDKVSGHRLGTAEIESSIVSHDSVG